MLVTFLRTSLFASLHCHFDCPTLLIYFIYFVQIVFALWFEFV